MGLPLGVRHEQHEGCADMCGIVGFAGWSADTDRRRAALREMCRAIEHRGPDEEGRYVAPEIALGMRRLSIIDVAGGSQPVSNEDGRVRVVFNGEIYNHRALRDRLTHAHQFRSRSDTEVLVHLYEERGDELVHDLRGMFAFAIWDAGRRRLLIARDRLGIKPLYYWPTERGVAFASELRSFLALPEFSAELDPRAVSEYLLFGYVPDPSCIVAGVRKLSPGHLLSWTADDGVALRRYWSPIRREQPIGDSREATEELRRLLDDAVASHLEADVPLGAFLSGGVDSSAVVATMARQLDRPVRTFSIGFDRDAYNEAPHAAAVAREIGTDHTELIVRPDADALVEDVVLAFDEPFADSSALPTLLVSRLAREHVTVCLSGDGGDELFAGYTRYAEILGRRELRSRMARRVLRSAATRLPSFMPGRNRLLDLGRTRQGRYAATVAAPLSSLEGGVVAPNEVADEHQLDRLLDAWFAPTEGRDFLTRMTLVDVQSYLPGDVLTKVDRASMCASLEARVPLLDHHLVEFALSLPPTMKHREGTTKWLFRTAIDGRVPARVLSHPKLGFAVPLRDWFRCELRYRLDGLLRPDSPLVAYVDTASLRRMVREHLSRRRDHSHFLWRLLVLDLWSGFLQSGRLARSSADVGARAGRFANLRAVSNF